MSSKLLQDIFGEDTTSASSKASLSHTTMEKQTPLLTKNKYISTKFTKGEMPESSSHKKSRQKNERKRSRSPTIEEMVLEEKRSSRLQSIESSKIQRELNYGKAYQKEMGSNEDESGCWTEEPSHPTSSNIDRPLNTFSHQHCYYCRMITSEVEDKFLMSCSSTCMLRLPSYKENLDSLEIFHCLIVPLEHCHSIRQTESDTLEEIRNFKKCLIRMASSMNRQYVFIDNSLNTQFHAVIDCISFPKKLASEVPLYFKKSLTELISEETSSMPRLIDTNGKGLKNSIPLSIPYFYADFALDAGYVFMNTEGSQSSLSRAFGAKPFEFGRSIIADLLGLDAFERRSEHLARSSDFKTVKDKFLTAWDKFDWTKLL